MLTNLVHVFSFPFIRYAFAVAILTALCSALVGVILVLKRFSFLGDGLSHFAFGVIAVATVLGVTDNMILVLPVTVLCAVFLLRAGEKTKVRGDAALAMVSVLSLAVGYLLLNVFAVSGNVSSDVCSTLFGSATMLTLGHEDVLLCAILAVGMVLFFCIFYNRIFTVTFDEDFAKATGTKVSFFNTATAIMAALVIVVGMKLVGSLLMTALIVFPALGAMRLFKSFGKVLVASAVIAVIGAAVGFVLSLVLDTPVGATMVVVDAAIYGVVAVFMNNE